MLKNKYVRAINQYAVAIVVLNVISVYHYYTNGLIIVAITGGSFLDVDASIAQHLYLFNLMFAGTWGALCRHMRDNDGWLKFPEFRINRPAKLVIKLNLTGDVLLGKITSIVFYAILNVFDVLPEETNRAIAVILLIGFIGGYFTQEVLKLLYQIVDSIDDRLPFLHKDDNQNV